MFDWKRRLLEIGLAGGLAASGLSCEQTCLNCCGVSVHPAHLANQLDHQPAAPSLKACGGSEPMGCVNGSMSSASVTIGDMTLGYSPQDVLDAANAGTTGSLTWWDGSTTKLRFHLDTAPDTEFHILPNPPNAGFCNREMTLVNLVATLQTDDGRLGEQLHATIVVVDFFQRFTPDRIELSIDSPFTKDLKGTLATDLQPLLPQDVTGARFDFSFLAKGSTCLPGCVPGQTPRSTGPGPLGNSSCFVPSGLIMAFVSYGGGVCPSTAYAASWQWD
jgi:hypothetical protein